MTNTKNVDSQGAVEGSQTIVDDTTAGLELEKQQHALLERLGHLQHDINQLTNQSTSSTLKSKSATITAAVPTTVPGQTNKQTTDTIPGEGLYDIVINANPSNPPLSVLVLAEILSQQYSLLCTSHVHSSAITSTPEKLKCLIQNNGGFANRNDYRLAITLIWKNVKYGPNLMVSPRIQTCIEGESNVARFLARLLNPAYDATDMITATDIDQWLDHSSIFIAGTNKERAGVLRSLNAKLGKAEWLVGNQLSLADIVLWSAIQQTGQSESVPNNVKKWLQSCNSHAAFKTALKAI